MKEYHKIQTLYKRDEATKFKTVLDGEWALPEFGYLAENWWVFTEKVDGTNIRVMWDGQRVTFGGKTDNAQIPAFLITRLQELFIPQDCMAQAFPDCNSVCLYGEGYGARIQKGGGNYKPDGVDFVLFDVKVGDWWLRRGDVLDVASKLGLQVVPIVGVGTLRDMTVMVREGFKSTWSNHMPFFAEGIVARPQTELMTRSGQRIIAKLKTKDFQRE